MWRLVLTVVLWKTIASQPVTDDPHSRAARQVDFVECCPCPGSSRAGLRDLAAAREAAVDDCPCRLRDTDSHGAPSDSLPRTVRPARPFLTPDASKDDVKPLLKPEVGLASSMLETLREVTDEEYQDALARDAARNAARVAELGDAQPDTAKNVVTIIVNPQEKYFRDATPEASQPFETRYVNPSEQVKETQKSPVFKLQPNLHGRNLVDMDSGASSVQENFIGLNKALEGLRLKTTPSVLKLFPLRKSQGRNIQSLLKIKDNVQPKNTETVPKLAGSLKSKLPSLKLPSLLRNSCQIKPLNLDLNKLNIPRIKPTLARNPKIDDSGNDDSNPSTSIIQEQFIPTENRNVSKLDLKSLLPTTDVKKTTFNLKSLLNLKDVELIPPKSTKNNLPNLDIFAPLRINKPKPLVNRYKSGRFTNDCNTVAKETDEESNEQRVHTEILNTLPDASEKDPFNNIEGPNKKPNTNTIKEDENIQTQILDALPSASDNNEVAIESNNRKGTSLAGISEENTDLDGVFEQQNFESGSTSSELLKDDVENFDYNDNSVEIFIENNSNNQFEEFGIIQENDQSVNEIGIRGSETGLKGLDLEIHENGANINPPSFTFIANDSEPTAMEQENQEPFEFQFEPVSDSQDFERFEFAPVQETDDRVLNRNDFFSQLDLDGVPEPGEENIQITSVELTRGRNALPTTNKLSENDEQESESVPNSDLPFPVRQRISLKIRNPNPKDFRISETKDSEENPEMTLKNSFNSEESWEEESLTEDTEKILVDEKSAKTTDDAKNPLNMQDLQQMSDTLLRSSEKKINTDVGECRNLEGKTTVIDTSLSSNEVLQSENETSFTEAKNDSDMDSSATSLTETFDGNSSVSIENFGNFNDADQNNFRTDFEERTLGTKAINNDGCPSNIQSDMSVSQKKKSASNLPKSSEIEMASAASEPVFKTYRQKSPIINPSSPLLQQSIVVQPSSLFPPITPIDLSTVTVPTLADIRLGISNILRGNAVAAEDEELDSTEDCSDLNPTMSSDASTTNTKSTLLPFRPLEDINLDIFQINPLSQTSLSSKLPSLNLNSFRTKLALPKKLDLKPMKLQSSLGGKNGGLLGATLTFGGDKISSTRKTNHITNLGSILDRQGSDILGNPLSNMPSFEDLRSKIKANTDTLFKSSLASPLDDTLRTTEALGNSLRSHTENTMRNIQQTLSSTLNEARVSNAGEKFAKPQDLLEMVTLAHEDVKDKLHGIHVDLQDRLSSIHDNILDRSKFRIPTLQTPFLNRLGRLQDGSSSNSRARSDLKKIPKPKLIVRKKKPTSKVNKPMIKLKEQYKIKPFKMSKAASSLTPKTVEVPKLMATSSKPPFLRPLQRDESVKLKEPSSLLSNDQSRTLSKTKLKPFGVQTKVIISTTPRPASIRTRPIIRSQFETKSVPNPDQQPTLFSKRRLGQIKSFSDSRGYASESQSMKAPAPVERESSLKLPQSSLPEFSLSNPLKSRANFPTLKPILPIKLTSSKSTVSPLTLSKPTDSPLVSKMREAIRIRFSRPIKTSEKLKTGLGKVQGEEEMSRSASENRGVAVRVEPMKENVSYKCKMICVRE